VLDGIGNGELAAGRTESSGVLSSCVDGNRQDFCSADELLGGGDDLLIFIDCLAELLLDVTYK